MNEVITDNMLEESGRVTAIEGAYVMIEIQQRSACSQCGSSDSCGTSVLSGFFSKRRQKVRLLNHLNLTVGDSAVIGINESLLLSTAVLAYMLPLLIMISFASVAAMVGLADALSFILSLVGLFVGMFISNRIVGDRDFESREIFLLRRTNESFISDKYKLLEGSNHE